VHNVCTGSFALRCSKRWPEFRYPSKPCWFGTSRCCLTVMSCVFGRLCAPRLSANLVEHDRCFQKPLRVSHYGAIENHSNVAFWHF
jgi:hypothetical protein